MLGTNSLEKLCFKIIQQDGTTVDPDTTGKKEETVLPEESLAKSDSLVTDTQHIQPNKMEVRNAPQEKTSESEVVHQVSLSKTLRLGPRQTQMAKVHVSSELSTQVFQVGRVSPSKELECQQCDLLEGLWEGTHEFEVHQLLIGD